MNDIKLWGQSIPRNLLDNEQLDYIGSLPESLPSLEWVWGEMDRVWNSYHLDNCKALGPQPVDKFYSHPVWLMNGIFTQLDTVSAHHRASIAKILHEKNMKCIADYGGGFGELALAVIRENPEASVTIIEPYPSRVGIERLKHERHIKFSTSLLNETYDAVIAQDILEHVEEPVTLAYQIASSIRNGGIVIFANCFYPVIKCHLPHTFHLRHTFRWVMHAMGLRYLGQVEGAPHAQIFQSTGRVDLNKARRIELISKLAGPVLNKSYDILLRIKHKVMR